MDISILQIMILIVITYLAFKVGSKILTVALGLTIVYIAFKVMSAMIWDY